MSSANRINLARIRNMLAQPHVLGYRKHPILHAEWLYMDLAEQGERRKP